METRGGVGRGEGGQRGRISVHSIGPNTGMTEGHRYRTDTHFHLFVLSGQCQHLSQLRLQLLSSAQGCLCPVKHQRREFMVSPHGPGCCLSLCVCVTIDSFR